MPSNSSQLEKKHVKLFYKVIPERVIRTEKVESRVVVIERLNFVVPKHDKLKSYDTQHGCKHQFAHETEKKDHKMELFPKSLRPT